MQEKTALRDAGASSNSAPSTSSDRDTPPVAPPHVPDHELLRPIGRGSYGEVWLARNVFGEFRAVKIIHRRAFGDNRPFGREFEGIQRYEPISRSHESQVQILHVGRNDAAGYFYYVMELADDANAECGVRSAESSSDAPVSIPRSSLRTPHLYVPRTLRSELEHHTRLPIPQCLDIGLALTTALAHLHGRGWCIATSNRRTSSSCAAGPGWRTSVWTTVG